MSNRAFEVLGIEPTTDGRTIRAAFLRLARIYHPDRFADQSEDVRSEAERRMKAASQAYESLRDRRAPDVDDRHGMDEQEFQERAEAYRKMLEVKQAEETRNRARWRRWQDIEREARARAEREAEMAASIAERLGGPTSARPRHEPAPSPPPQEPKPNGSAFEKRLEAARRGETAPLANREPSPE